MGVIKSGAGTASRGGGVDGDSWTLLDEGPLHAEGSLGSNSLKVGDS
jgi:hypothetical protein